MTRTLSCPGMWATGSAATMVLAVAAASFGLHSADAESADDAAPPSAPRVSVAAVVRRNVSAWEDFSGRLEAVERVDIRSRVAGAVQSVHFREGTLVKKGDLLFTIDPEPYAAEVDRAQAQVVAAQARLAYAHSESTRAEKLLEGEAIARRDFDERSNAALEADANLRAAQAALQSARLNLGYTQVRAPVSGRVGKLEVTLGNLVAAGPGAPVLTTLVSMSPIYASFEADERSVALALKDLRAGGSMRTQLEQIPVLMGSSAQADTPYRGKLQLVDNQVDTKSGTVRVRAVFDNANGELIPGQFAHLRMGRASASQQLLINERAVGTDQSKKFVLVVGEDHKAVYREVTLGPTVEGLRIVVSGLAAGEHIVVNGLQRVRPGAEVTPQPVAMDAKSEVHVKQPGA